MSYSYGGGSSMGAFHGMAGQGYSYAALVSSSDPGDGDRTSFSRRPSTAAARPRVDRRYSPPPRRRPETGPSSVYAGLESGLTPRRTALTRYGRRGRGRHGEPARRSTDRRSTDRRSTDRRSTDRRLSASRPKKRPQEHPKHGKHDAKTPRKNSKADKGRRASTGSAIKATPPSAPKKASRKGKSKGLFGWGCFGI